MYLSPPVPVGPEIAEVAGNHGTASDVQKRWAIRSSEPRRRHPSAHRRNRLGVQSAARVQGGEAGERSERILDAREH